MIYFAYWSILSWIEFADNASIEIGSGLDMKLYHDGTNSYITNAVGALKIATESTYSNPPGM